jgi:hypothetical protein
MRPLAQIFPLLSHPESALDPEQRKQQRVQQLQAGRLQKQRERQAAAAKAV